MQIVKLCVLTSLLAINGAWAQVQSQDFSHWQVNGELKPLDVEQQQFVSLWLEEETPQKRGTVILLPDWGVSPSAPNSVDSLRQALPKLGWETGAVLPPAPMQGLMQQIEAEDTEQQQQYKKNLQAVIEAAKQNQQEQFGFQVIVAQGVMGAWLVELLSQQQLTPPDGLVLISAYYPNQQLNKKLAEQTAKLPIPVLDIYAEQYNQWQQHARELRLTASNKNQKLNYRQTHLPATADNEPNSAKLNKTVYGWFSSLGWY
ncbi:MULTISPECIES: DUF3530 family protein [unclassified Agarivorans]|uniref:DUF3530 family protein n=1 Tax=unclassified Agarivorans TaxID=2636026 RepID=UPI0026E2D62D|nr:MULTISPECIES: DUF3530 family protein [unclassified Agarivorans]MDO6688057.1 DUF3530 family protein [Agarivorans sp. 3_MG-2023]MDO6717624.1 DUF3530 family protein [Agarivorans sp. 2_MG-2023]